MIEKISLRLFWTFMLVCALSTIAAIWVEKEPGEGVFKIIPTTFILGVASALIWAPHIVYRCLDSFSTTISKR